MVEENWQQQRCQMTLTSLFWSQDIVSTNVFLNFNGPQKVMVRIALHLADMRERKGVECDMMFWKTSD